MKKLLALLLMIVSQGLLAGQQASEKNAARFAAVDIFVDASAHRLAAYQLEFFATTDDVKIAGIEGGEHPAFAGPPFYDPQAMQHERVILGAFSTEEASSLPDGKTRIATIHMQIRGANRPEFKINLQTAADSSGKTMKAQASFVERDSK